MAITNTEERALVIEKPKPSADDIIVSVKVLYK